LSFRCRCFVVVVVVSLSFCCCCCCCCFKKGVSSPSPPLSIFYRDIAGFFSSEFKKHHSTRFAVNVDLYQSTSDSEPKPDFKASPFTATTDAQCKVHKGFQRFCDIDFVRHDSDDLQADNVRQPVRHRHVKTVGKQ